MRLRELLQAFRSDLNDINPAGTLANRWSDEQLLRYFNEGMCHVFSLRRDEFIEQVLVPLEAGTVQKLCDCKYLHKILGQTDETGLVVRPISKQDSDLMRRWTKRPCSKPTANEYVITGYTYNPDDNGYFNVYPPVPPNEDVYIKALCATPPEPLTIADMDKEVEDCQAVTAARQWVLHAALAVEDESESSLSASRIHLESFFSILKVQNDAKKAFMASTQSK